MIALIALVLSILTSLVSNQEASAVVIIPAKPQYSPVVNPFHNDKCMCDDCYYDEAYCDYADEFTALFNSYSVKRAKNNALMIRKGNSGPYRFAKKG